MALFIDGYPVDVELLSDHSFTNDVTDNPVEDGADITDNVRSRPLRVTIEGLVTDSPIGAFTKIREEITDIPSEDAYSKLKDINTKREPVTITTSLQEFPNMVLESLSVPRSAKTGEALKFRAVFKQIRLVSNDRTFVVVAVPRARKKRKRGSKTSKDVSSKITQGQKAVATFTKTISNPGSALDAIFR